MLVRKDDPTRNASPTYQFAVFDGLTEETNDVQGQPPNTEVPFAERTPHPRDIHFTRVAMLRQGWGFVELAREGNGTWFASEMGS